MIFCIYSGFTILKHFTYNSVSEEQHN